MRRLPEEPTFLEMDEAKDAALALDVGVSESLTSGHEGLNF